ncbi:hypothetical protein AVEN_103464-1 [Araneus ventricosus]|uniref:RING-type domain-containing protein n=1 Tax=Araneus ventricosus TaxID=182803 RepID=A0A4Y2MKJ6_ARAVE|nr:hypothetical protein AVEN_103464-1 [Araneus ventricosus]
MTLFCQMFDEFYEYQAKKLVLSCGHDVHEKCAKRHLWNSPSCCLKCLKPLTDRRMREDSCSADSEGDSSTSSMFSNESTDDDFE